MGSYIQKVGTLLSQTVNALVLGGNPDQSISSRAWANKDGSSTWATARSYIDAIFGKDHCKDSFDTDVDFALEVIKEVAEHKE